jgi:hypothetical protein
MLPVLRMGVQGPLYQDNSNNTRRLQGTILVETNFVDIYVLNYIFLSSNILSISLYITAWKLKNLNKNIVLTSPVTLLYGLLSQMVSPLHLLDWCTIRNQAYAYWRSKPPSRVMTWTKCTRRYLGQLFWRCPPSDGFLVLRVRLTQNTG